MRRDNALLPLLLVIALALALVIRAAAATPPSFSPSVTAGGLTASDVVSTDQVVAFTFSTGLIISDSLVRELKMDLGALNPLGQILSSPAPSCPAGIDLRQILNNRTLICSNSTPGGGLPSGSLVSVGLTFDRAPSSGSPSPLSVTMTLTEADGNATGMDIPITVQNKPMLAADLLTPYPATASKGQLDVPVTFRVTNNASFPAAICQGISVTNDIRDSAGSAIATFTQVLNPPTSPPSLGMGESVSYTIYVSIPANAANGTLTHVFNFTGSDINSGAHYASNSIQNGTLVLMPPNLTVLSVTNSTPFISFTAPNNTVNVTIQVRNDGQAAANITGKSLVVVDSSGNDRTSFFFAPVSTDGVSQVPAGQTAALSFNVTGLGSSNGAFFGNFTISYADSASGISYGPAARNGQLIFTYDTSAPAVSVVSPGSGSYLRQTERVFVNATVTDNLAGVSAQVCTAAVGGIQTAENLTYSQMTPNTGTCSGNVTMPSDPSIYGTRTIVVSVPDAVANRGSGGRDVTVYTLVVNTTDAITAAGIKDGPDISDAIVTAVNTSGAGSEIACAVLPGTISHLCPVPLGTVVNITAYSPAYVRNNAGQDRVCVGTGNLGSCSATTPAGGFVDKGIALQPNTVIMASDEFGNAITGFNVTIQGSTGWFTYVADGGLGDEDGLANGTIVIPLDSVKHVAPFNISFNIDQLNNRGYSAWQESSVSPSNFTQTVVAHVSKFILLVTTLNQFDNPIDISGGSVVYNLDGEFGFLPVACQSNGTQHHVYGCKIPTYAEISDSNYRLFGGARITVIKGGYVNLTTARTPAPANPSAAQSAATTRSNFTVLVQPRDSYNRSDIAASNIASVTLPVSGACQVSGNLWGCPAVPSLDLNATVVPANSSGFLQYILGIAPSEGYAQLNQSLNLYTVQLYALNQLGSYITSSMVSSVSFNGSFSCVSNPSATYSWGCAVPVGTAAAPLLVGMSGLSAYLNQITAPLAPPASVTAAYSAMINSSNNFSIKLLATDEFQDYLSLPGINATFLAAGGSTVPCLNSSFYEWFCPVQVGGAASLRATIPGYIDAPQQVVAPPASGQQGVYNSSDRFTVLVYTRDELNGVVDVRPYGNVTFGGLQCVNSTSRIYEWGCPGAWLSAANVSVRSPGFMDWNSSSISASGSGGPQTTVSSANQYTLKVFLTDELGADATGASVSATGLVQPSCSAGAGPYYYCAVSGASSTVTASKTGFVTASKAASGMSSSGPQVLLQMTNQTADGLLYAAKIQVVREAANNNTEMGSGVSFINSSTGAPINPSATHFAFPNVFYFAFPPGTQGVIVRKSGYVDELLSFSTGSSYQYTATSMLRFSVRVNLVADNGTGITGGASFSPAGYFQNGTTPYYFFPLPDGDAAVSASKPGFINGSAQVTANGTYPASQAQYVLTLPYALKVASLDWGGKALNGTTVSLAYPANNSLILSRVMSPAQNTAYFDIDPASYPALNVIVGKQNYNTVPFANQSLSSSAQTSLFSRHAQNVIVNVTDWRSLPVEGVKVELLTNIYNNIAECITTASGICTFLSVNGPSTQEDMFFNNAELSDADTLIVRALKANFGTVALSDGTYMYQNDTTPFSVGTARMGGDISVTVFRSWNLSSPLSNATVHLFNLSSLSPIATGATDSAGSVVFHPDYYGAPSPSDTSIVSSELADLASYLLVVSKTGYADNSTTQTFNSSAPASFVRRMTDNAPPMIAVSSPGDRDAFYLNDFYLNFSLSEPYGEDGAGLDPNRTYYRIENASTGAVLRDWSRVCPGSADCSVLVNRTWDLPVGLVAVKVNSSDLLGNVNIINVTLNSQPDVNVTATSPIRLSAYAHGMDYWKFVINATVKGSYAKIALSNFFGAAGNLLNITGAACPAGYCARMSYFSPAAGCGPAMQEGNLTAFVGNAFDQSQTPGEFCDQDPATPYAREQSLFLTVLIPAGASADRYNATYGGLMGGPAFNP